MEQMPPRYRAESRARDTKDRSALLTDRIGNLPSQYGSVSREAVRILHPKRFVVPTSQGLAKSPGTGAVSLGLPLDTRPVIIWFLMDRWAAQSRHSREGQQAGANTAKEVTNYVGRTWGGLAPLPTTRLRDTHADFVRWTAFEACGVEAGDLVVVSSAALNSAVGKRGR